jgi:peptide/nickel transport system substrate-binding protein
VTGGTWTVASIGDAETLIPLVASDSASYDIIGLVYCKLLEYDGDLELRGDVAERWEVLDDGLRLRFHMRKDARWHDGTPLTADDVVFTIKTLQDPGTATPYRSYVDKLASIRRIDAHTVEVVYRESFAPALHTWASGLYILPKHLLSGQDLLATPLRREPIGCGPWRFRRWDAQTRIVLERNPDWHRRAPRIAQYNYRIIPDQATMFLELLSGGLDQMGLTPQQYARQTDDAKFKRSFAKYTYTGFNYTYLGFNLQPERGGPERFTGFTDARVRRALAHAVDKQEIIDGVLFGLGEAATGPYRPGMWYYNGAVSEPAYDPATARRLLDEAGWRDADGDGVREKDGKPFRFTILTNQGNKQREQVGQILQQRFRAVGVDVELRILEWSTFLTEFVDKFNFDAVILGWSTGIDPDQYLMWHSSKTGPREFNFIGYVNPEVDALLETARATFDREVRRSSYHRLQEILAAEQPYIFLYVPQSLPAVHRRVVGVEPKAAGIGWNFEDWWIPADRQGPVRVP